MASTTGPSDKAGQRDRKARLAEELRANLQRRKAQARARRGRGEARQDGQAAGDAGPRTDPGERE